MHCSNRHVFDYAKNVSNIPRNVSKLYFVLSYSLHGVWNKMLSRKVSFSYGKTIVKYLSSVPVQKVEIKSLENVNSRNSKPTLSEIMEHPDYFSVQNLFTIKEMFEKRVHYGHKITSLNSKMKQYIFGSRLDHLIFDLNVTATHLQKALNFTAHVAYQNGIILFVSRNPSATLLVERTAAECGEYAVTRLWKVGTFTDSTRVFNGVVRLPDLCIFLNTLEENGFQHIAIKEAAKLLIPTIAIVDSNCDPEIITYPVPGNDDSIQSIAYYCHLFKNAILRGKNKRLEHMKTAEEDKKKFEPEKSDSSP